MTLSTLSEQNGISAMKKFFYAMCVFMLAGATYQLLRGSTLMGISSLTTAVLAFWASRTVTSRRSHDVSEKGD